MPTAIPLKIILQKPPAAVVYGLQKGSGNQYEVLQKQRGTGEDLHFELTILTKPGKNGQPDFSGPEVQGPAGVRFIYINIGISARQFDSVWNRRLKIPLYGITDEQLKAVTEKAGRYLQTTVPGTGKDGGPNCATVKPFAGWVVR